MTQDQALAAEAHDALWAVLWNRRYDDVDEPIWSHDGAYSGILGFARDLDAQLALTGVDTGDAFVVFGTGTARPPIGSRVRVLPAERDRWRIAEVQPIGLGIDLRFDDNTTITETAWIETLRDGVLRLRKVLDAQRDRL
ncbi:MAG: hypothetical protein JWO66_236, partial [Candidatus Eremiobacteraeota bacterium]|nr:hypothetical protein [Candidatus Eremiobacteraeota bacterium]